MKRVPTAEQRSIEALYLLVVSLGLVAICLAAVLGDWGTVIVVSMFICIVHIAVRVHQSRTS
jgi:uncharacterized membrane protein